MHTIDAGFDSAVGVRTVPFLTYSFHLITHNRFHFKGNFEPAGVWWWLNVMWIWVGGRLRCITTKSCIRWSLLLLFPLMKVKFWKSHTMFNSWHFVPSKLWTNQFLWTERQKDEFVSNFKPSLSICKSYSIIFSWTKSERAYS